MMFKRIKHTNLEEITQYVKDIEKVYHLRNKARADNNEEEADRLEAVLEVMEVVLVRLNERIK